MPCKIVGGTKVPRNERSRERKFQGTFVPGNETFVPGNEKSRERKFPIGTISSWERKVLGTKSPGTPRSDPGVWSLSIRNDDFFILAQWCLDFTITANYKKATAFTLLPIIIAIDVSSATFTPSHSHVCLFPAL